MTSLFYRLGLALSLAIVSLVATPLAQAERVRDLVEIQGVRINQLVGYGIVIGLDGTGDQTTQTPFTVQTIQSMLTAAGINLPPGSGTTLQLKNVAAVMVTANLPSFARPGQQIDVTVSSIGNSKSIRGGTLLMTPLKGADGQVYAIAQGNILLGGAGASSGKSSVSVNQLNAGRVPAGATVERPVLSTLGQGEFINLELRETDFGNAEAVAEAINSMSTDTATALDGRVVRLRAPPSLPERVAFLARIEDVDVKLVKPAAKVIINARTGSVVMNQAVTLDASAVAHGSLSVTITNEATVSQPNPFGQGRTEVVNNAAISIKADKGQVIGLPASAKLTDVVKALNSIGATPQDLLSILQSLKAAGALRADLEVI